MNTSPPRPTPIRPLNHQVFPDEPCIALGTIPYHSQLMIAAYHVTAGGYTMIDYRIGDADSTQHLVQSIVKLLEQATDLHGPLDVYTLEATTSQTIFDATAVNLPRLEQGNVVHSHLESVRTALSVQTKKILKLNEANRRNKQPIIIATDASRRANHTCAFGWIVIDGHNSSKRVMRTKAAKVNDLEAKAIIYALLEAPISPFRPIYVLSDSKIALKLINTLVADPTMTHPAWAIAKHAKAQQLPTILQRVHLYWVKGHSGNPANEAADLLVRGTTLAAVGPETDRSAVKGLNSIMGSRLDELKNMTIPQVMEGAKRYNRTSAHKHAA